MSTEANSAFINHLTSDLVRSKYGGINLKILKQDENLRISIIADLHNINRVFAITLFKNTYSENLMIIHKQIINGDLIGESIRRNGFDFIKVVKCNFVIETPLILNDKGNTISQGQLSEIYINRNEIKEYYCQLCEIFSAEIKIDLMPTNIDNETSLVLENVLQLGEINTQSIKIII